MLVHGDERLPLARLLKFMELGERLAQSCATSQALLARDASTRRFFRRQARHEALHAAVFQAASDRLASRHLGSPPCFGPLDLYRRAIEQAVFRGDLAETLMGQQVILEGLGEVILRRMEVGLAKREAGFTRLRRTLLRQEEEHHAFGLRALEGAIASGEASKDVLKIRGREYIELATSLIVRTQDMLSEIHEDAADLTAEFKARLPQWLTS